MRLSLAALVFSFGLLFAAAPAALADSSQPLVIVKIKHVGDSNRAIPVFFIARDPSAADLVKNAVLEHRTFELGGNQFEEVRSFWVNEVRDSQSGPLLCGDVLPHGSFEIAGRAKDGSLGFDFILPPAASAEHLRRFEQFLEERQIDRELATNLKAMLAAL